MAAFFRFGLVFAGLVLMMPAPVHAQVKSAEMKKLLKERHDLLNDAMEIALAHFKVGSLHIEELLNLEK